MLRSQRNKTRSESKEKERQESRKNKKTCLQRGGQPIERALPGLPFKKHNAPAQSKISGEKKPH